MLPDDVLLEIFDFYLVEDPFRENNIGAWQLLVHVCRRWRNVVFGSSRRLDLRLVCTPTTPARDTLDIWPALPLLVYGDVSMLGADNIIAALERSGRVCTIDLDIGSSQLENVSAVMEATFPELTGLSLALKDESASVIPDSFLDGFTTRLLFLYLDAIPFPGLPKLLLSATHLVDLRLLNIPHSGYMSPEAMVTCLSALASLKEISFEFQSPLSHPDWQSRGLPPPAHSVLSTVTSFWFKGVSEYFDDLVARIDTPRLNYLYITFFNQIDFNTPQLVQYIRRTPTFKAPDEACVVFHSHVAWVKLQLPALGDGTLRVVISCREPDWQLSSLAQVCTWSLPPLSTVEILYIYKHQFFELDWQGEIEKTQWLELLRPFTAVKKLCISKEYGPRIILALRELVGDIRTEVLPALQNIFLEEIQPSRPVQESIEQFISARQLTNSPVAISLWDRDMEKYGR
jgi:hypothetical protein